MAEWADFCSPAYKLETPNAECSRMVNVYSEVIERGPRAGKFRLRGIPGLKRFGTLPGAPVRGMMDSDSGNRLFCVGGSTLYEVFSDGTSKAFQGNLNLNNHPVTMVGDGQVISIASGGVLYTAQGGNPGTVAAQKFTDGTDIKAATVTFLDTYAIVSIIDSKDVFISAPGDLTSWDPGDTKLKEGYPDNISRVYADNEFLWVFGFDSFEPWVNTGALFPFERANSTVQKIGCTAPYSFAGVSGYRFWLWNGAIYMGYGFIPQAVSDYGVEEAIKTYGNTQDAEGFAWADGKKVFYLISFPSARRTWVFDLTTKFWHERGYWDVKKADYDVFRGRVYAKAFGKHLVGDPYTGDIYEMDPKTYTDAGGAPLRRQRVCPYFTDTMKNIRHNQLTIDMDTGVGLDVSSDQSGYDPQVAMRYSDDRAKTWKNERTASAGLIGDTTRRVIFNQNGSSRIGKVYEVVFTDPCPLSINTAYLRIGGGN